MRIILDGAEEDPTEWHLQIRDSPLRDGVIVEAAKMVSYAGVLRFSTEDRTVSARKNSQYQLTKEEVIEKYHHQSETSTTQESLEQMVNRFLADLNDCSSDK